jgi:hypothetical protein
MYLVSLARPDVEKYSEPPADVPMESATLLAVLLYVMA